MSPFQITIQGFCILSLLSSQVSFLRRDDTIHLARALALGGYIGLIELMNVLSFPPTHPFFHIGLK